MTIDAAVFNGEYSGPILRVHPGDVMRIKFINHLSRPANIHYHGLETSPLDNGDNIHISVKPGETFNYEIKIEKTQAPGIYWYHDHTHGISEKNVMDGLSGTLIVEGFSEQFPALAGIKEQILVLKDYEFPSSKDPYIVKYLHRVAQSINGQALVNIKMQPGETQLWRLTNQSANRIFHVALQGHKFRVIANDGRTALQETVQDTLDIVPAGRVEVLVDAGAAGNYDLMTKKVFTDDSSDLSADRIQGKIIVSGEPKQTISTITSFAKNEDLSTRKIDEHRTIVFSQLNDDQNFFVNGRKYNNDRIDIRVPLGNTEEWTIRNDSDDFHVFHIHQVHFQITEIDGKKIPFNGYVDNANISSRSVVKLIIPFTDPVIVGKFVLHCHVLRHEDHGMMAHIEVYDPDINGAFPFYKSGRSLCTAPEKNPT